MVRFLFPPHLDDRSMKTFPWSGTSETEVVTVRLIESINLVKITAALCLCL